MIKILPGNQGKSIDIIRSRSVEVFSRACVRIWTVHPWLHPEWGVSFPRKNWSIHLVEDFRIDWGKKGSDIRK